jgi:hypothetical protein
MLGRRGIYDNNMTVRAAGKREKHDKHKERMNCKYLAKTKNYK